MSRFTILEQRGHGGMGVVWRARDEESGEIVALKLIRDASDADSGYLARFAREAELAQRVRSEHVVRVLASGLRDGLPYLALEYVDGPSLKERLVERGPYAWPEGRELLRQLAAGLADVHAAGILHRDIKPSNILLAPDGSAKLTDFGIARGLDLTRVTGPSTLLGTPAYLPPEGFLDARSDLYSLGCVAYELLTGMLPFEGPSYQEMILQRLQGTPDLSRLPPEARPIVGSLLARDPAARPQSAAEFERLLMPAAAIPVAFCPTCGARRWTDARYCGRCGRDLADLAAPFPASQPGDQAAAVLSGAGAAAPQVESQTRPPIPPPPPVEAVTGSPAPSSVSGPTARAPEAAPPGETSTRPGWVVWTLIIAVIVVAMIVGVGPLRQFVSCGSVFGCSRPSPVVEPTGSSSTAASMISATATPAGVTSPAQAPAAWQPTGQLAQARWGQGAATLADGRILAVGGTTTTSSVGALASVEIYDPASGIWTSGPSLREARAYPVVVSLADGRVLVVGGARDKVPLASTEIFDPTSGTWTAGPAMTTPRSVFAGVRLTDGRVLVVGGGTTREAGPATASAEIYDPASNTWRATAPMHEPRAYPTATLLPDGRVLVVGGETTYQAAGPVLGSAELFDPHAGTWTKTGPLVVPVYGHSATLLSNGDVLVAGGWISASTSSSAIATAQLFDPRSDTWTAAAPMEKARADARALALPDGRVVEVGGLSAEYTPLASVEIYDPSADTWAALAPTPVAEWWGTLVHLPSGGLLLAGGSATSSGSVPLREAAVLPLTGTGP
jgi:hypothetical protein